MLQNPWRIQLLGAFAVQGEAQSSARLFTRQNELLLALLAANLGQTLDRREVIDTLWPRADTDAGRNRLRVALSHLRQVLEPAGAPSGAVLRADRAGIALSSDMAQVDVKRFCGLCEQANRAEDRELKVSFFRAADTLYRGPFLAGWQLDWVEEQRLFYSRLQASSQRALSVLLEDNGELEGALLAIRRAVAAEPLMESLRKRELNLLAALGDPNAARESYDLYRKLLKKETGLHPSVALRDWAQNLPRARDQLASTVTRSAGKVLQLNLASLSKEDRKILHSLSVFKGAFDLAAAAYVAKAPPRTLEKLAESGFLSADRSQVEILYSVVDRDLVSKSSTRSERENAAARHAAFYRKLLIDSQSLLDRGIMRPSMRLFFSQKDLRAALDRTLQEGDPETITSFVLVLTWVWVFSGGFEKAGATLREVRNITNFDPISAARMDMAEAILASFMDDSELAKVKLQAALPVVERERLSPYDSVGKWMLGWIAFAEGDFHGCLELSRSALARCREHGLARWDAASCALIGNSLRELGDFAGAADWLSESVRMFEDMADAHYSALSMLGTARLAWLEGCLEVADARYKCCLAAFKEVGDLRGIAFATEGLGRVAISAEDYDSGARSLGASERLRQDLGVGRDFADKRDFEASVARLRAMHPGWEADWRIGYDLGC